MFRPPGAGLDAAPLDGCAPVGDVPLEIGWICGPPEPACEGTCLQLDESNQLLCTGSCTQGESACPDSFYCGAQQSSPNDHFCLPARSNFPCEADSDCVPPEVCRVATPDTKLDCSAPPAGLAGTGESCTEGAECKSGVCLELGLCTSPCRSASDCPDGWRCDPDYTSIGGADAVFVNLCRPGQGSLAPCWSETDCQPSETCRIAVHPSSQDYRGTCGITGTGADAGASCSSDSGCKVGVCTAYGTCSILCKDDSDCPAGYECKVAAYVHRSGMEIRMRVCMDIARETGQPCPGGDGDCANGLFCYNPAKDEPYCTRECTSQADCEIATGQMQCTQEPVLGKTVCVRM
ncbi:MAG: hypothetical protein D6806_03210 [Deltaproteobacteria bacterium]|nr:MAG: hypothetical protein D6806_03210 [Deltaproteobacteria bacterium]